MFPNLRNCLCIAIFVCLWIGSTEDAVATDYYVRTDGNDSNTGLGSSASEAWATVAAAVNKSLNPGDIVYVAPGTYTGEIAPSVDGTSGSPIQFIADRDGSIFGTAGDVTLKAFIGEFALVVNDGDYLSFKDFRIEGSDEDVMEWQDSTGGVLEKCEIFGGQQGIQLKGNTTLTLINCLIRNTGDVGINVRETATVTVWNCTITELSDSAIQTKDGDSCSATVTNSIIANCSGAGFKQGSSTTFTHTYNLVYNNSPNFSGTSQDSSEITSDPRFVGGGDYHLFFFSPAIDAGTDATGIVDDDLDENARPADSGWDMGCYEFVGRLGHWAFDEGSGSTAADSTTSANDATLQGGATWTSDCAGNSAVEFDGSGAFAITAQPFSPPPTGTVAFWMRSAGTPAASSSIFGLSDNWEARQETDGTLSFDLGAEGQPEFVTLTSLDQADRWYHVVVVFDAADDSFQVYVDGQLDTSGVNGDDMVAQSAGQLSFGTRTGSSDYWERALRDFR
ncbi:MAG: right-handed parallel beta-helix repeat-containing protein, partial [Planctomycetes bacterium]|nr:right-handed parallel beta-helix repeat-containing protein [Planctomycetota bacterium]